MNIIQKIKDLQDQAEKNANDIFFSNVNFFARHQSCKITTVLKHNHKCIIHLYKCEDCLEYIIILEKIKPIREIIETLNPDKEISGC